MPYCWITHDSKLGAYEISFEVPRTKQFKFEQVTNCTAFIKTIFPASHRSYDPVTKIWVVLAPEERMVAVRAVITGQGFKIIEKTKKIIEDFFYNQAPAFAVETKETLASKLETLLTINIITTPFDELKKAYRRKALELHPDRNNGDGARMSELNAVWTAFNRINV